MAFREPSRIIVLATALAASACGGPLAEGKSLFDAGRYPQAKQVLAAAERESASWTAAERAEYQLYRGLTLAALGDWSRGARWLALAKAAEDTRPGSLSRLDALRLTLALDSAP